MHNVTQRKSCETAVIFPQACNGEGLVTQSATSKADERPARRVVSGERDGQGERGEFQQPSTRTRPRDDGPYVTDPLYQKPKNPDQKFLS